MTRGGRAPRPGRRRPAQPTRRWTAGRGRAGRLAAAGRTAGGDRRGHRRHPVAAPPQPAAVQHHDHRRRHRRPLRDAGVLQLQPLARPPHRLGPGVVRRLSRSTPSTSCCPTCWPRWPRHVIPYNIAFKLVTILGSVLLPVAAWACGRLFGLRAPGAGGAGRRHPAVPLRLHLHHLRGEPLLDAGRRVRLLAQPVARPRVPRALRPRAAHRPAPGLGRRRPGRCASSPTSSRRCSPWSAPALLIAFELLPERLRFRDDLRGPATPSLRAAGRRRRPGPAAGVLVGGVDRRPSGCCSRGGGSCPSASASRTRPTWATPTSPPTSSLLFPEADLWALVLAGVAVLVALRAAEPVRAALLACWAGCRPWA